MYLFVIVKIYHLSSGPELHNVSIGLFKRFKG